jgi:outer membrane biosynthesis protein TonB
MLWIRVIFRLVPAAALALICGAADAQSNSDPAESPIHAIARFSGLATNPPPPPDFVREGRPTESQDYEKVFRPYDEPGSNVKSKDDLKAMGDDLQKTDDAHQKLVTDEAATPTPTPAPIVKPAKKTAKKADTPKPTPSPTSQN